MTLAELMELLKPVAPDALFDEDGEGQVIVFTGLILEPDADWQRPADCELTHYSY
jgi:hypothetical protein